MLINALIPIVLPLTLILLFKLPARTGMGITLGVFLITTIFVWQLDLLVISSSLVQGLFSSMSILLILYGAILMLNTLKNTGAIVAINNGFRNLSEDMRIQAIIVAFLFGSLIEGASGFGTPAVVVGPLLVALGFRPILAVTLALVSDSVAVTYGAVGTPIAVGLQNLGLSVQGLLEVSYAATILDFFAGSFIPLILVFLLTYVFIDKNKRNIKDTVEMIPFALLVGFTYTFVNFLVVRLIGFEFTSIVSPIVTIMIAGGIVKLGVLVPKNVWTISENKVEEKSELGLVKAWSPYLLLVALLLITRIIPVVKSFVTTFLSIRIDSVIGVAGINVNWAILYSPGVVMILAALFASFYQSGSSQPLKDASVTSFKTMLQAALALVFTLSIVQIYSNSGIGMDLSMPRYLANYLAESVGSYWYLFAPFVGQLGAFITGSATVSTLTFSPIQYEVAMQTGLNTSIVLGEQMLGGASGNMICIHNIVAAATVVGLVGRESEILKKTIFPTLFYGLIVGLVAYIVF